MKIEKIVQLLESRNREDVLLAYEYLIHAWGTERIANMVLEKYKISVHKIDSTLHIGYNTEYHSLMDRYLGSDWVSFSLKID